MFRFIVDFGPVRMLTMWLLVYTTRVAYSYYCTSSVVLVVLYNSVWSRKQSKALTYVWTVQKLKTCSPLRFWRPHTSIYYQVLLFGRKKKKMFWRISWAKNTARGVRFLLRFNMYLFLAQCEQVNLFLALALFYLFSLKVLFVSFFCHCHCMSRLSLLHYNL